MYIYIQKEAIFNKNKQTFLFQSETTVRQLLLSPIQFNRLHKCYSWTLCQSLYFSSSFLHEIFFVAPLQLYCLPCINIYSSLGVNQPAIVVLNSRYIWCIYKYNNKRRSPTNVYNNMSIVYVHNRVSTAVFAVCPVDPARGSLSPGGRLGPPRVHIILCSCFALYVHFHIFLDCL